MPITPIVDCDGCGKRMAQSEAAGWLTLGLLQGTDDPAVRDLHGQVVCRPACGIKVLQRASKAGARRPSRPGSRRSPRAPKKQAATAARSARK